jgi:hypothetical protein
VSISGDSISRKQHEREVGRTYGGAGTAGGEATLGLLSFESFEPDVAPAFLTAMVAYCFESVYAAVVRMNLYSFVEMGAQRSLLNARSP